MYDYFGNNQDIEYERVPWIFIKSQNTRELLGIVAHLILAAVVFVLCMAPLGVGVWGLYELAGNPSSSGIVIAAVGWLAFCVNVGVALYTDAEDLFERAANNINDWVAKPAKARELKEFNSQRKQEEEQKAKNHEMTFSKFMDLCEKSEKSRKLLEEQGYDFS